MNLAPDQVEAIGIIVLGLCMFVVVPLIIVFTEHQRKMIKLLRGQADEEPSLLKTLVHTGTSTEEIAQLRDRVTKLEAHLAALEASKAGTAAYNESLSTRLG